MKTMIVLVLLSLVCATTAWPQTPAVDIPLTVSDGAGGTVQLKFGLDPSATDGVDAALGEVEQPPLPPTGAFAARFIGNEIGLSFGEGLAKDYRQGSASTNGTRVHELLYQVGSGTSITISWTLPAGVTGRLQDLVTGTVVDVSMSGTGQFVVTNPGVINKLRMTATYAFASSSTLNVTVQNVSGWDPIRALGEVQLRDGAGGLVGLVATNASSVAVFPNVPPGSNYQYGVFYVPTDPDEVLGREFWGKKTGITLGAGQTVNETLQRNMPYTSEIFVYDKGTGADVERGVVLPGTTLRIRVEIANPSTPGSGSQNVRSRLILDRNKALSYDFDQSTAGYQTMAAGTTRLFDFEYTPIDTGAYLYVAGSLAEVLSPWGSGATLTEGGQWWSGALFTVRGTAATTVNVAVQNVGGRPAIGTTGEVQLKTSVGSSVGTAMTDASSVAAFSGVPPGTDYQYGVYCNPADPNRILGREFWGRKTGVNVSAGQTVNETFQRNMPYASNLSILNKGTGGDVTGGVVPLGTTLQVRLEITNPSATGSGSRNVKGRVILDQTRSPSYAFDQTSAAFQTIASGATGMYDFEFTPTLTGDYYHVAGAIADVASPWGTGETLVDGGAWADTPSISVGPAVGGLNVTVQNAAGHPGIGATGEVQLRTLGGAGVDTLETNASGIAAFSGIPAGTDYQYGVYCNPTDPDQILGREFWGRRTGITVTAGQTLSETFQRNMPYHSNILVVNKGTGVDVKGAVVQPGTTLRVSVEVTNPATPGSGSQNVQTWLILDRTKTQSFDFDRLSAGLQPMLSPATRLFEFEYTPVDTGQYFHLVGVIADVASPWGTGATVTEGGKWSTNALFTVRGSVPLPPTLVSPADAATGVSTSPLLSWNASAGATSYRIQLSGEPDFDPLAYDSSGILGTSHVATWLSGAATYYWRVSAANNWGQGAPSTARQFTTWSGPYNGVRMNIPGTVEAEAFDAGGEGTSYHDSAPENLGQACRTLEGVDIVRCQDAQGVGYNITSTEVGEWLRYSVNVAQAGTYILEARVALGGLAEGQFHLSMGATDISGPIRVAPTGGWQVWTTVKDTVVLVQGDNQLFLHMDNNGAKPPDFNFLRFAPLNQVLITIATSPTGRQYTVDGALYNDTHQFSWTPSSNHTLGTFSPQAGSGAGIQYVFAGWSDGGAETHQIQPASSGSYTASFGTEYYLTIGADNGGSTTPTSRWYASGASITITALPPSGYRFLRWDGTGEGAYSGTGNPAVVEMRGPISQQARFEPLVGVSDGLNPVPEQYVLAQNYPNPFNPVTTIRYGLPVQSAVRLTVFSQLGQTVEVLVDQIQDAGYHEVRFDGATLPSGLYFYRIQAGEYSATKKLLLVR